MKHRSSLRQLWWLVIVACTAMLALGAGPALAQAPAREHSPTELWQEYPLNPGSEEGATLSVQSIRTLQIRIPSPARPERSSDSTLLIGGFALVVLILSDTLFLTLLGRRLRETA